MTATAPTADLDALYAAIGLEDARLLEATRSGDAIAVFKAHNRRAGAVIAYDVARDEALSLEDRMDADNQAAHGWAAWMEETSHY